MRILEVARGWPDHDWPLNGIFEWDQSKALRDAGHQVVYAALDVRSVRRWRKWGCYLTREEGIPVYHFSFPVGAIPGVDQAASAWGFDMILRRMMKQFGRPDLVHVHFGQVAASVAATCLENHIPYVVTEHSSAVNTDTIPERDKRKLQYTYSHAAAVIAVSQSLSRRIREHTGVEAKVIPNIIDLSKFQHNDEKERRLTCRLISAGNLKYEKGFDTLIRAFSIVREQNPEASLLIMGDGPEREALREQIQRLGLENSVTLYGRYNREEFAEKLRESDVFVLASRSETFGVVYAEAMAAGLPVIASRCGGPEDFVNERNGLLVPVDDVQSLTEAMLRMLASSDRYDRGEISRCAQTAFSSETIGTMISELFQKIIM